MLRSYGRQSRSVRSSQPEDHGFDQFGSDLSDEVASGRDDVELGERFLGIGIDDFRHVCCIDQEELTAVQSIGISSPPHDSQRGGVGRVGSRTP